MTQQRGYGKGQYFKPLIAALEAAGYEFGRGPRNHFIYKSTDGQSITVPSRLDSINVAKKIAKAAGVTLRGLFVAAGLTATLHAEPPSGANPAFSPFYHSITGYGNTNSWCCSQTTDCREVQTRKEGDKWFFYATKETFGRNWQKDDAWLEVPENAIAPNVREDVPRPASAVACVYNGDLRCFTPPMMGG